MRGLIKRSPRLVSFGAYVFARFIGSTLRWRVEGVDQFEELIRQNGVGLILVSWHGRTFLPVNFFRGRGYWSMISTSRDGEYQDRIFKRFGFNTVRGSSSARGAVQATLNLIKQIRAGQILAMTPDGPRGPSGCVQPGVIYLAMKSGCPIIPAGMSAHPRWLMKSWDRYLFPVPFARAVMLFGKPFYVPSDARSEEAQQLWAEKLGCEINALERRADWLAGAVPIEPPAAP